ncbi:tyrosinase family protein [Pseudomonas sp. NPDC089734]|uniref:tyrosinase family protein n=1 Tax=Pseudomonas sp. NPDC089734 TaxID=3364469 RepID=UPI0037F4484E
MTIRRRTLLKLSALAGGAMILPDVMQRALAASNTTKVRHAVSTPEGKLMLAVYARAVGLMMKKPSTDPLSWIFQWYTHSTPEDKEVELQKVFGSTSSPHRQMAETMWFTCEPHRSGNSDAFLPWHRMYVLYLEQIVRDVSGDQAFTLPYWDYVGPSCTPAGQCTVLPEEFRKPNHPLWGSLYRPDRNPGVNDGKPVDASPYGSPLTLDCMKSPRYRESGSDAGFCANLDNDPHGVMHDNVGDDKGMGVIAWAANDPIFWLHHCNIDRIWASWNKAGGLNPQDTPFTSQSWTFSNGQGLPVVAKVSDVLDTTTLASPYIYDSYLSRPAGSVPFSKPLVRAASVHAQSRLSSGRSSAIALTEKPVKIALASQLRSTSKAGFGNALFSATQGETLYLTLSDISASAEVGNSYGVYLNLPANVTPTPQDPSFVGTISFFGVGMPTHGGHHTSTRDISFVVTDIVQKLTDAKRMNQEPTITFAPIGKNNVNAKPVVGSVSLQSS